MRAAMHASLAIATGIAGGAAERAAYSVPIYEQPAAVAACAADLGQHTASRRVVPPACAPFPETIDVTGTATGNPADVRYSLPTAANFQQNIRVEAHDWNAKLGNNETFAVLSRGALLGFLCLALTTGLEARRHPTVAAKPKSTHYNH